MIILLVLAAVFCKGLSVAKATPYWPDGTYGLPQPVSGCPNTDDVTWETGWRRQHALTGNVKISNAPYLNASAIQNNAGIMQTFCTKIHPKTTPGDIKWAAGKYCIYKYGDKCPLGMRSDSVHWSDSKIYRNSRGGVLPAGNYGVNNTTIEFCCNGDGDRDEPIELPVDKPFYLLPYELILCQHVKWTVNSIERIVLGSAATVDNPKMRHVYLKKLRSSTTAYYCYYKACRSHFKMQSGSFSSNNSSNQYCSWTIVLQEQFLIILLFTVINIPDCSMNYMDIYDGVDASGQRLARLCGENATQPMRINSTRNALFVMLKSGKNFDAAIVKYVKFQAEYESYMVKTMEPVQQHSIAEGITAQPNLTGLSAHPETPSLLAPQSVMKGNTQNDRSMNSTVILIIAVTIPTLLTVILAMVVVTVILYKRSCFSRRHRIMTWFQINMPKRQESINPMYEGTGTEHKARNNPVYSSVADATYEEVKLPKSQFPSCVVENPENNYDIPVFTPGSHLEK